MTDSGAWPRDPEPADGPAPAPEVQNGQDEQWQHLHPLSPLLRGGIVAIAIIGYVVSQSVDTLFSNLGGAGTGSDGDPGTGMGGGTESGVDVLAHPFLAALGALAVVAVVLLGAWVGWRFSLFRITPGQVELRRGWVFRRHRQVNLDRVQAIEISRPLLAQLLGLSQVVVQSAGGGDSQLKLAFLDRERADAVRDRLLDLAGRTDERRRDPGSATAAAPAPAPRAGGFEIASARLDEMVTGGQDEGRLVLAVPNGRLFVATLLHASTLVLLVMLAIGGVILLGVVGDRAWAAAGLAGALPALGPVILGVGVSRVGELLKHGNYRMTDLGSSLRIRHGLTDHRTTTVPLHRVQAMEMFQPLWWRPVGWWRARVNVAGVGGGDDDASSQTVVLPVGTLEQALGVLTLIDPRLSLADLSRAALDEGTDGGWTLVSPRARLLDLLSWRRKGYAATPDCLLIRTGALTRSVVVVPHARVQSITVAQGPLERRLGLAGVHLVSTPGPVSPVIDHLPVEDAERLLEEEGTRARAARMTGSDGWLHDEPGS